jgi:DHA1 family multidrug resistance protein-like MFS transporter
MKNWKTPFISILIAETLAIAGFATSMPVIPLYLQDLGIRDSESLKYWSGLIQSVASIAMAVTAPIWGSLADSRGKRLMLLRSMLGGAVCVGLQAFATSPWQILVLRALQGAVTGTVAAATVLVAGIVPTQQIGFTLGVLQTGIAVGNSVGPLVGGVISDFFGRRAAFATTSLILIAAGIIVLLGVENDSKKGTAVSNGRTRVFPDLRTVFSSPALSALMAVSFALQASMSIPTPMMPLFIQELTGDPATVGSATGMVLGAGAAATAIAAALVGRLAGNLGYARTLIVCIAGGALLTIPQAFAANPLQLALIRVASMLFLGGAMPAVNALLAAHSDKDKQGAVFGLSTSVSSVGVAIGPAIGSATAAVFDFRAVFIASAALLGGTVAAMRAAAPRAARAPERTN